MNKTIEIGQIVSVPEALLDMMLNPKCHRYTCHMEHVYQWNSEIGLEVYDTKTKAWIDVDEWCKPNEILLGDLERIRFRTPEEILDEITEILSGEAWDSNTPSDIANVLTANGYEIKDLPEAEFDEGDPAMWISPLIGAKL